MVHIIKTGRKNEKKKNPIMSPTTLLDWVRRGLKIIMFPNKSNIPLFCMDK